MSFAAEREREREREGGGGERGGERRREREEEEAERERERVLVASNQCARLLLVTALSCGIFLIISLVSLSCGISFRPLLFRVCAFFPYYFAHCTFASVHFFLIISLAGIGEYLWTVPAGTAPGSDYFLSVWGAGGAHDETGKGNCGETG